MRKRDLLAYIESGQGAAGGGLARARAAHRVARTSREQAEAPAPRPVEELAPGRREPMSPMRQAIARHMVESRRTAAHCTTIVEADLSRVTARRRELREQMRRRGVNLTYLAFVALATVEALQEHPKLNASVDGSEIVYHDDVNLGIAVALEDGLIVPVIRQAQRLSLEGMAAAIADLAERAREKRLEPDDVHGGTFTITNPGQFGAVLATPIINQPQVAILDLEAIVKRPIVVEGPDGDSIAIRPMTYLCMSWDHRALDGADAARFLGSVKDRLESWEVSRVSVDGEEPRQRAARAAPVLRSPRPSPTPRDGGPAGLLRARGPGGAEGTAQRAPPGRRHPLDRAWAGARRGAPVALRGRPSTACATRCGWRAGMTYKAAAAGLEPRRGQGRDLRPERRAPSRTRAAALCCSTSATWSSRSSGRYLTAEDVGIDAEDLVAISERTRRVTGLPADHGGSGDPSPFTALGVEAAMRACARERFGSPDLSGRRIVIAGLGHVGSKLARLLAEAGAELAVSDIDPAKRSAGDRARCRMDRAVEEMLAECDILAPCALGGAIDAANLPGLVARSSAAAPTTSSPTRIWPRRSPSAASCTHPTSSSTPAA